MTIFTDGMRMPKGPQFLEDAPAPAGAYIGAVAADSFMSTSKDLGKVLDGSGIEAQAPAGSIGAWTNPPPDTDTSRFNLPEIGPPDTKMPMSEAQDRVKKQGLEGLVTLPAQDDIGARHLDIMLRAAHSKAEQDLTLQRGTEGFVPNAMAMGTSFLVGALDPVNLASAFVPIVGEARYAKLMASAGESVLKRAAVRAGVGAAEGAAGQALIEPILWKARTQDGKDYGMADVLHNLIFGAVLGSTLHTGGGAVSDFFRRRRDEPLYPYGPRDPMAPGTETPDVPPTPFSVMDDAYEQLRSTGMREEEAQANAAIVAARYQTRAERLGDGRSAADLYRAEGLSIRSGSDMTPEGERVYAQNALKIETPEFKTWFGDSKIVDDHGAPEVVYHGTDRYFDQFDMAKGGTVWGASDTNGVMWFTSVRSRAEAAARDAVAASGDDTADNVVTAYLSMKNPLHINNAIRQTDFAAQIRQARASGHDGLVISPGEFGGRDYVVFAPQQIKSTHNRGSFDPRDPRILYQTAPTFYSALDNAVTSFKQEKASPEQWIGTLKNTPGVKAEEMQWLGIDDWLKEQKGAVTKQQLQDYIRSNQVEIKEITKGIPQEATDFYEQASDAVKRGDMKAADEFREKALAVENADAFERIAQREFGRPYNELQDFENNKVDRLVREDTAKFAPKFAAHTLPGGDNYKEILLTLPPKETTLDDAAHHVGRSKNGMLGFYFKTPAGAIVGGNLTEQEALLGAANMWTKNGNNVFRSSHFKEPNILAHVRFNDRIIDGKKTLFLEEVQSDWHQAGKRKGYIQQDLPKGWDAFELPREKNQKQSNWVIKNEKGVIASDVVGSSREDVLYQFRNEKGVPNAPFKTTWPELALKRMIRYAAEHGYEKVAWTTGEQQVARYDLSKQISRIEYLDDKHLIAYDKNTGAVAMEKTVSPDGLADVIGKDAAEKLMAVTPSTTKMSNTKDVYASKRVMRRTLDGDDLKVGGEGMKGFYDKILPTTANKLVKKFGGKVQNGETIADKEGWHITPPEHTTSGKWMVKSSDYNSNGLHFDTEVEAKASLSEKLKRESVHTLDITPDLKKVAIERGFPLFQGGDNPRGRITLDHAKATVELFAARDASTFMHEAGHLWLDELVRDAAHTTAPSGLKDDMATVLKWLEVDKAEDIGVAQHEKWAQGFEQYLSEGRAPSKALAAVFERFKDWLKTVYQNMRQLGAPVNDEIRGVMDRMLANDRDIAQMIADLPPRAKEDAIRGAIANVISDEPVRVGEMLHAAAETDPRIAEVIAPAHQEVMPQKAGKEKSVPETLTRFLASIGGIKPTADLQQIFDGNPFIPGYGRLFRQTGLELDYAREAAVQAGFMRDHNTESGLPDTTTTNELLRLLDDEARGTKVYRIGKEKSEVKAAPADLDHAEHLAQLNHHLDEDLKAAGLDPNVINEKDRARALEIMQKDGIIDPGVAYERAVMEATEDISDATGQKHRPDNIPGWDVPDDGSTAQGDGIESAGLRPSRASAEARERGPANRAAHGQGISPEAWRALATHTPDFDEADVLAASESAAKAKDYARTNIDERLSEALAHEAEGEATYLMFENTLPEAERLRLNDALNSINAEVATREQVIKKGMGCMTLAV